jgi:hypothetical protein
MRDMLAGHEGAEPDAVVSLHQVASVCGSSRFRRVFMTVLRRTRSLARPFRISTVHSVELGIGNSGIGFCCGSRPPPARCAPRVIDHARPGSSLESAQRNQRSALQAIPADTQRVLAWLLEQARTAQSSLVALMYYRDLLPPCFWDRFAIAAAA